MSGGRVWIPWVRPESVTGAWYIGRVRSEKPLGVESPDSVLFASPADSMPDGEVEEGLRGLECLARRVDARRAELIAVADDRGIPAKRGFGSTTAWLMALSGEPAAVCRSRVGVATALEEMPETRKAFASGEVSESRVRLLAQAQAVAPEQFAADEAKLVAEAAAVPSPRLPQVLLVWRRETDPEGAEADAERLHGLRALHISPAWSGMVHLNGDLDPEGGGVVLAAIRSLAEPAALDPADTRPPAQRQADALTEICHRYLNGDPGKGSGRPHLAITIPWNTLKQGAGVVDTEAGPISAETARRIACDATLSRVITSPDGIPVAAGEARRVIPPALRRALELRDKTCTHPGCDVPARWCDAHHLVHWADGGKTVLANLRLLCRTHHREEHDHQPYPRRQ
jgi:hypothetical protein